MVRQFNFTRIPAIYFGTGKFSLLPGLIKRDGSHVLLVTGKSSFPGSQKYMALTNSLTLAGIEFSNAVISGEPSPSDIDEIVRRFSPEKIDLVIGVGGGSVLDAGKAVSAMMYRDLSVRRYLEGVGDLEHPGTKLPFIAVPTTSGTGSEATRNAVISEVGRNGFKKSLRHDNFVPDAAVVDPDLTVSCPTDITASGGMDCFTQLIESFLSVKSNEYSDALAWEGLKAISSSLRAACADGADIGARSGMSFAALTSGICLANAGLGAVHGFASSIGGMFRIPHGIICGTLMAPANALAVKILRKRPENSALEKYARLGQLFLGELNKTRDYYVDGFIRYLEQLGDELKLPGLGRYGIGEKEVGVICSQTESKNNPVKFDNEELAEIVTSGL